MTIIQEEYFSEDQCNENPQNLYVFGDNSYRYGKKGQAVIRDCINSIGIPTKRKPSMAKDAFMRDEPEDFKDILSALGDLVDRSYSYKNVVFPKNGLGTGLSKMNETSPILFKKLYEILFYTFGLDYKKI